METLTADELLDALDVFDAAVDMLDELLAKFDAPDDEETDFSFTSKLLAEDHDADRSCLSDISSLVRDISQAALTTMFEHLRALREGAAAALRQVVASFSMVFGTLVADLPPIRLTLPHAPPPLADRLSSLSIATHAPPG